VALEHKNVYSIVIEFVNEYWSVIPYSFVMQLATTVLSKQRGLFVGKTKVTFEGYEEGVGDG
jgi:hypothetical protein